MIHYITRATRHFLIWTLVIAALSITGLRLFLSEVKIFKIQLESSLSEVLEVPVRIGKLRATMRGFDPELVLKDIDILHSEAKPAKIQFREIHLGINFLDVIKNRQFFSASWLALVGAKLSVKRKSDGSIAIVGLKTNDDEPLWLMQGGRYEMRDSDIIWQDELLHAEPVEFNHVNIFLENGDDGDSHRVNIVLRLPEKFGDSLTIAMDFNGNIFEPGTINGRSYFKGERVQLAELITGDAPGGFQIGSGNASFELWSEWQNSRMVSLTGDVQLTEGTINRDDGKSFAVDQLETFFNLQRQQERWRIAVNKFSLQSQGRQWPESRFILQVEGSQQQPMQKLSAFISQMDVEQVAKLALFAQLLDSEQSDVLKKLKAKGAIKDLSLFADFEHDQLVVNGFADAISLNSLGDSPGLKNFSATLHGSEQAGTLHLMTDNASIDFPDLFRDALNIKRMQGKLDWRQDKQSWSLFSPMIELDTPDIKTRNQLNVTISKTGEPTFMDLQTFFFDGRNAAVVKHYLPVGIMDGEVVEWLDNAFISGDIEQGQGLLYGQLKDFPFVKGEGVFQVLFEAKGVELDYDPQWPNIIEIDAQVQFLKDSLQVNGHYGRVNGAEIQYADVAIPSFSESNHLLVEGEVIGEIEQGLDFILLTPLADLVAPVLQVIAPQGKNSVSVDLEIPLIEDADVKADVALHLENAELVVLPVDVPVKKISGDLMISESGVYCEDIKAEALGYPIQLLISNNDQQTTLNITGRSDINRLQEQFPTQWWRYAEGTINYNLQLLLPYSEQQRITLLLNSDLAGLALDLPGALAKTKPQQKQLSLEFGLSNATLIPVKLEFADQFKAAVNFNKTDQTLFSANILYGHGDVGFSLLPGINLTVKLDSVNVDPWLDMVKQSGTESYSAKQFSTMNFQIEKLFWKDMDFGKFALQMARADETWKGSTSSRFAQGDFLLPSQFGADSKIKLDLNYLDISAISEIEMASGENANISPLDIPLFEIQSRQLIWQSINLGALDLQTERGLSGLTFNRLDIKAEDKKLSATGGWNIRDGQWSSNVEGILQVDNLGHLLSQLDATDAINGSEAVFGFTLNWPGAPYQFDLSEVMGELKADLQQGRLSGVDPGLGRALGILDLWQLDRRVRLDFSDLYADGLTYNRINGSFEIARGVAETHDLVVDALPAKIEIKGHTDLFERNFDQIVTVMPKSSVAVPIAGTIMGRIADFIKQTLTGKRHVGGFFNSSQYAVKGKWGNADIIPLHENDGLLQKAWGGITGIPDLASEEEQESKHE